MPVNPQDHQVLLPIKAVPGASRNQIAGMLGDRIKVRISAAPEAGKANASICALIARSLKIKCAQVSIHTGHTNPEKTVRILDPNYKTTQDAIDVLIGSS
ncbi:MAG: DUF167 domain-containing protein [Phycisphaerales bacterium]